MSVSTQPYIISPDDRILITGSNGFIGVRLVRALLEYGFENLRCFVRASSSLDRLNKAIANYGRSERVEIFSGDLLSSADCERATSGVSVVYHLAAGFDKSFAGAFMNSVLTTRNLIEGFLKTGAPERFVNVSSFAVYSNLDMQRGALLDETCPLETSSTERCDAYGFGKLKQEEIVRRYGAERNLPFVILRPGFVYGAGKKELSGRVGVNTFGFFFHLGGTNQLPMTFVENCADAIALAGLVPGINGEVFNVVDDETLQSRELLRAYRAQVPGFRSVSLPYRVTSALSNLWERYSAWSHNQLPPVFNRRRCSAEWKGNRYSNQKLKERLGWQPRVSLKEGLAEFLGQFTNGHP
jgi:nucleoside-diphosphate-sugar epimerase